jgi:hypothetical protein
MHDGGFGFRAIVAFVGCNLTYTTLLCYDGGVHQDARLRLGSSMDLVHLAGIKVRQRGQQVVIEHERFALFRLLPAEWR